MRYCADTWFFHKLSQQDEKAIAIWKKVLRGKAILMIPAVVITELKRHCVRKDKMREYKELLEDFVRCPYISIESIDETLADQAGSISATFNVPTADSLIVACGVSKKCNVILSDDRHIKKIRRALKIKVNCW